MELGAWVDAFGGGVASVDLGEGDDGRPWSKDLGERARLPSGNSRKEGCDQAIRVPKAHLQRQNIELHG